MQTSKKPARKVKTSSLVIGIIVILIFSIVMGISAFSIGFGSFHPQLNLIVKPFVCPNGEMSYTQHVTEIGTDTYYTASWSCTDEQSGDTEELDSDTIFRYAGIFYGLALFAVLLVIVYLYWNSSIGPAQNDGLELW
jgi:hypothetical protein